MVGICPFVTLLIFFRIVLLRAGGDFATPVQCTIDGRILPKSLKAFDIFIATYPLVFFLLPIYISRTVRLFHDPRKIHDKAKGCITGSPWIPGTYADKTLRPEERHELVTPSS
jgi:hypothetical protein